MDRKLTLEIEAAQRLKEKLKEAYGDDVELIRDMIEGETSLNWMIGRAATELAIVEGDIDGITGAMAMMAGRKERHQARAQGLREAIRMAMEVAELDKLKTPAATLSIVPAQPKLEIIEMSKIPESFMVHPLPQPDKNAIKNALKAGEDVPGCMLSNGGKTLTVRFT